MRLTWRGGGVAAVWLWSRPGVVVQAQEKSSGQAPKPLVLHARMRESAAAGSFVVQEKTLQWDPARTAVIVCDMWNEHECQGANRRVGELAPAVNKAITARARRCAHHPRPK